MTPTKEQYQRAAALVPDEIVIHYDGVWAWDKATKQYSRPWEPLTWQDGGPLLAKVEKWLDALIKKPSGSAIHLLLKIERYQDARASGNEPQWLEAGFFLACAIQESVG